MFVLTDYIVPTGLWQCDSMWSVCLCLTSLTVTAVWGDVWWVGVLRVRLWGGVELVQSWRGRHRNNMETEAETEYQDWGDYGQHWGVDRVKLQFKTGLYLSTVQSQDNSRWVTQWHKSANQKKMFNFEFLCLSLWSRLHPVIVFDVHRCAGLYERKIKKILSIFLLFCKCNM